jgi:hypothetical protein
MHKEVQGCMANTVTIVATKDTASIRSIENSGILKGYCPVIKRDVFFNVGKNPNNIDPICENILCEHHTKA